MCLRARVRAPAPPPPRADDIASCTAYFELLANYWWHAQHAPAGAAKEELSAAAGAAILQRLARLRDPRAAVVLLTTLTLRRCIVPAVAEAVQARFEAGGGAALRDLDGHYLASLAHAAAAQGGKSRPFFAALAARGAQLDAEEGLEDAHWANLAAALSRVGVEVPPRAARAGGEPAAASGATTATTAVGA